MLLVLLLSLCKSFQISPFRVAHECFILESGCKSTHFPGNFQMFLKKSSIFKRKLIYVKRKKMFFLYNIGILCNIDSIVPMCFRNPHAFNSRNDPRTAFSSFKKKYMPLPSKRHAVERQPPCDGRSYPLTLRRAPVARPFPPPPKKKKKTTATTFLARTFDDG